jgi:SNF2 family DNA or RNA helicase
MENFKIYLNKSKMVHKQYQYDGVEWMLKNELRPESQCNVRGGFVADEMGLGKTIMMIGLMLCNYVPQTLIVVPPILINQWYSEIYRTTGHKALVYHGEKKYNTTIQDLKKAKIVITTYAGVTMTEVKLIEKNVTLLHRIKWDRIIFDEAHHLRNSETSRFKSVKLLSSKIRWLVSGTPIQNSKKDFYSLCSIIRIPTSFYIESENLPELAKLFILKRTKKSVGIKMPEIIEKKKIVNWKNKIEKELSETIHSALKYSKVKNKTECQGGALSLIIKARQSCIYPKMIAKFPAYKAYHEAFNHSSKLDSVVTQILMKKDNGCGKLIFCHFREEIDVIAAKLREGGMTKVETFDGRTVKRKEILCEKNEALILQIQTGCEGLNLQEHYSEIYFISPHWNPAVEDQAIARCHRIGQTKRVVVYRFEMNNFLNEDLDTMKIDKIQNQTIDKYIGEMQDIKRKIAEEYLH